jgi:hypothetical protein
MFIRQPAVKAAAAIFNLLKKQRMLNFRDNLYMDSYSFKETKALRAMSAGETTDVPSSKQISGMEVRLSKAYIIDNKTAPVWPFPGLAKVYFMNIIVSDLSTAQIALDLNGFEKVGDKQTLSVDRTLFYWKKTTETPKAPSQIHIMSSLIKSKKPLRDVAKVLAEAKEDAKFKSLTGTLAKALKNAADFNNISNVVFDVAAIVGELLGKVEDKPLLTRFQSFTDMAGNFNQLGRTDMPFSNRYAEVDYSIYIRDKAREDEEGK